MGKIKIEGYICERCYHKWVGRKTEEPRVCPKCKNPYWNKPRKKKVKNKFSKISKKGEEK